ncbi:glutathione S-transferase 1-1-like [Bradysia coprophila]|uniref:glutathione S-transferase 1-1-like n=1 Tax=Bradysia coprophila TaxID=38358 RepID=UPI00187D8008|nr:glutathione S-transferase 1-1-like [Bradysia coprophila]
MAPIVLYYCAISGPCRVALSTIRHLGIDVEIRVVDLLKKEHLSDNYIKINHQHTVPVLDDDGFILTESRAIAVYLVEKYFPSGHSVYPNDARERALINQFLHFDCGTLYPRLRGVTLPAFYQGQTTISDDARQKLFEAIGFLNTYLEGKKYVSGSAEPTIADFSLFSSVANIVELGANLSKYANVVSWYDNLKKLPSTAENIEGAKTFANKINSILQDRL